MNLLPYLDITSYRRYFEVYDRSHESKLGPEPSREQILEAAEICRKEGRLLAEPLMEASEVLGS